MVPSIVAVVMGAHDMGSIQQWARGFVKDVAAVCLPQMQLEIRCVNQEQPHMFREEVLSYINHFTYALDQVESAIKSQIADLQAEISRFEQKKAARRDTRSSTNMFATCLNQLNHIESNVSTNTQVLQLLNCSLTEHQQTLASVHSHKQDILAELQQSLHSTLMKVINKQPPVSPMRKSLLYRAP